MKNKSLRRILSAGIVPVVVLSSNAWAQSFDSNVDSKVSSANLDASMVFDSSGTLIGDYDADTNPTGTQTIPGLFGGSGNNPINTSVSTDVDTLLDTNPAGSFVITPDFDLGLVEIDGLVIDLLNGQEGGTDLSITMLYDTFHTINPSFLYLGGVPITLPIGQVGGITQAVLTQTAIGAGTLSPTDDPNIFDIAMLITAQLDMEINTALPGQDPSSNPIEALPIVLPIAGQIETLVDGTLLITIDIAPEPIALDVPIEGTTLPPVPLELPTFGTETASVIFTSVPESITVNAAIGLTISATGNKSACAADLNGDGNLDFFDVSDFLSAFAAMDPAADFNGDGVYDFFDVSAFLGAFADGCP